MAADSAHAAIEKKISKASSVFDFSDMVDCVKSSFKSGAMEVYVINVSKIRSWKDLTSKQQGQRDISKLNEVSMIEFCRGKSQPHISLTYSEDDLTDFPIFKTVSLKLPNI